MSRLPARRRGPGSPGRATTTPRRRPLARARVHLRALLAALVPCLPACGPGSDEAAAPDTSHEARQPADSSGRQAPPGPSPHDVAPGGGWFTDVTAASGLHFVHDAGMTEHRHLPETMGAGAALFDVDADGDLDAYVVQSGRLPGTTPLRPATPERSPTNRLFTNDGRARFRDVTDASGAAAHPGYGMAVVCADVEMDGDLDLFVTNVGPDVLLLNDGAGAFTDGTGSQGLDDDRWTSGATFVDADEDGDPDLFVTAYVDVDLSSPVWCGLREPGWRSYCHPDAYPGLPDRLWTNDGRGAFRDTTDAAGLATAPGGHGKGLGVVAGDLDGDGHLDLYVANDSVENRLWLGRGDGTFADGTLLSGTGVNGRGLTEAGMGLALGDVDGDRDADLFVTNFDDESNTLYRNDGDGLFTDVTARAGLDGPSRLPVGFGTVMADLDADGDLDLALVNGHIIHNIHLYHDGKRHAQRPLLFANDGTGRFTDVTAEGGALGAEAWVGRGLYDGDLDGDGHLDLLVTECDGPARVLRNDVPGRGRGLVLSGLPPGSRVEAEREDGSILVRDRGPWPSYYGQTAPEVHLGLGASRLAALTVVGPDGSRSRLEPVPGVEGRVTVVRDGARLELHSPGTGATMPGPPSPQGSDR